MIEPASCSDCSQAVKTTVGQQKFTIKLHQSLMNSDQSKHNKQPENNQPTTTALPPAAVAGTTATVTSPKQQSNFHLQASNSSPSPRLNYFQPQSQQQAATALTIATPHYHQHRLFLAPQSPLLFPAAGLNGLGGQSSHHYHQPAASTLAAASSGGTNGSLQQLSSLSPDARACFTATYLCVLIVNNTWLDCNLLEMLCNGTTSQPRSNGVSSSATSDGSKGDDDEHLSKRNREQQLEAFETILDELVAFAGGGRGGGDSGRDEGGGRGLEGDHLIRLDQLAKLGLNSNKNVQSSPRDGIYIAPMQLAPGGEPKLPRQVVPPDDGGGGAGSSSATIAGSSGVIGNNSNVMTLFYTNSQQDDLKQSRLASEQKEQFAPPPPPPPSLPQIPRFVMAAKLNQLSGDDDQIDALRQYFDMRRSQLASQKSLEPTEDSAQDQADANQAQANPKQQVAGSVSDESGISATSTTQTPNMSSGLITNWISRPLRDWGSYLFWSSAAGDLIDQSPTPMPHIIQANIESKPQAPAGAKQDSVSGQQQQQQQTQRVQLLRPIDRTETYNTIPTNQTSQKQQQLILEFLHNSAPATVTTNNHRAYSLSNLQNRPNNHQTSQTQNSAGSTLQLVSGMRGSSMVSPFAASELADQMNIPLTTLSDLVGSPSSVTMTEIGRQQSSASTSVQHSLLRQHQQQQQQVNNRPPSETSYGTLSMRPAYDAHTSSSQAVMQLFRDSPLNQQQFKNIQQQQQQQQQQQNVMFSRQQSSQSQFARPPDECDCGQPEFLSNTDASTSPSGLYNAYPESCHRNCQLSRLGSSPISSSTPSLLDQTSPVTSFSTTSSTSLTTSGGPVVPSGGKMNPLDITFLLYTRRHRDMISANEDDLLQIHSTPTSPSTRNPLSGATTGSGTSGAGGSGGGAGGSSGGGNAGSTIGGQYSGDDVDRNLSPNSSSNNIGSGEILDLNNEETLSESSFNGSLPVKLIIHGFGSGGRRPWVTDMVYKLLDYENVNVIVVDWEKGATLPNYVQAAGNTRLVGHKIATLIRSINARHGMTASSYHLIGFSLGAHVAGFAGMEIRNSTSISHHWINRITGLDPASPLFEGYESDDRLDPSDAQFVDVIHSNGDGVLRGGFGSLQPMGHVDFYPNGGRVQVGCNSVLLSALSDIIYGKWQSLCNHRRALNFFMDSFEFDKCKFRSFNCDSYESYLKGDCFDCGSNEEKCSYMGYLANYSKGRGKMYLTTHEEAPFCANQFLIKIIGTKGFKTHWGKVEVTLVGQDGRNESFWLSATSQQSTSHELPSGQKDLIQHNMQSLVVSHLALANLTHILLRYTKYRGWIYSGGESWSVDKVYIADSDGRIKSFCGHSTALESHITTRLNLDTGNCTISESIMMAPPGMSGQQTSRSGGPTTASSSTLITSSLQQQQQQQQPQSNQPRTPRLFSPMIQSLGEPQASPVMVTGHTFQLRSMSANDWHQPLSQLGFGKFHEPSTLIAVT